LPERSGGGQSGFSAKWVLTLSNKHHHFRFAEETSSENRTSSSREGAGGMRGERFWNLAEEGKNKKC